MTAEVNHSAPRNRSRFLYLGFIASLAINLLFVGGFAAAAWHHHQEEIDRPKGLGLLGFVANLPSDRQEAIRQEVVAARDSMKQLRASMRQAWLNANAMLTDEPFDKAKFSAALQQLKDLEASYRASIYNMVANTAEMLTPDERKLLQAWRVERRAKFLGKHDDKDQTQDKDNRPLTD
ncbi:periplasmic heavy metal sensor [Hyphomicrobium sp.]|uniref:periplasmic heavy metal sensor n=1 Tax=Hyphomicrobium sp. TaxID=82 RepID=UPI0035642A85